MRAAVVDPLERYAARRDRGSRIEVETPEGLRLSFTVAPVGDRLAAFLLDALRIALLTLLLVLSLLLGAMVFGWRGLHWFSAFGLVAFFFLRNFYFAWHEVRHQGVTPGKRRLRLRVIDAHGRPLRGSALLARNLTRELELFLPLAMLQQAAVAEEGGLQVLLGALWLLVPAVLPFCDARRRRAGDWLGGTMVVLQPDAVLLADLSKKPQDRWVGAASAVEFTPEQLEAYGIYEVQVLEELLRDVSVRNRSEALRAVSQQVAQKIGWTAKVADPLAFLRAFYAAERAHLERKLLLGQRKERKEARQDR